MSEARRQGRETGDLTGQGQIHARVSIVASTLVPPARTKDPHAPTNPNCIASSHEQVRTTTHTHTHKHTYGLLCTTTARTHMVHTRTRAATLQSEKN